MSILKNTEKYVSNFLEKHLSPKFTFHTLQHTLEVLKTVHTISVSSGVSERSLEHLKLAAWFHDTGYCFCYHGHEDQSVSLMEMFLKKEKYPFRDLQQIKKMILATRFPQKPVDQLESIICDADLAHLSRSDYHDYEKRLRKEWENCLQQEYTDQEWIKLNLGLLSNHKYFTHYGMVHFQPGLSKNAILLSQEVSRWAS